MSFPDGSLIRDMAMFLDTSALESAVLELRPELAGCVRTPEAGRPLLSFEVADDRRVVAGLVNGSGRRGLRLSAWMIADGGRGSRASFWFQGTKAAVLAKAVVARVDAVLGGKHPASPWRWDEASSSPLTELADELTMRGAPVALVVAHNRCVAEFDGADLRLRRAPDSAGHFLEVVPDDREEPFGLPCGRRWAGRSTAVSRIMRLGLTWDACSRERPRSPPV